MNRLQHTLIVRTFGYYRPDLWPKSADNYLYNGLLKHWIETRYDCYQNWQLAALFYVQRRQSCQWALSFHSAVNSLSGGRLAKIGLGRAVQVAPPCEAAADSCSLMSLDWWGGTAAGHDHRYHPSCIADGRGQGQRSVIWYKHCLYQITACQWSITVSLCAPVAWC